MQSPQRDCKTLASIIFRVAISWLTEDEDCGLHVDLHAIPPDWWGERDTAYGGRDKAHPGLDGSLVAVWAAWAVGTQYTCDLLGSGADPGFFEGGVILGKISLNLSFFMKNSVIVKVVLPIPSNPPPWICQWGSVTHVVPTQLATLLHCVDDLNDSTDHLLSYYHTTHRVLFAFTTILHCVDDLSLNDSTDHLLS